MDRYEIEPRPAALGGGWRLHLIGHDLETGEEVEMGGGAFPVEIDEDDRAVYADAAEIGEEWLCAAHSKDIWRSHLAAVDGRHGFRT